MAATVTKLETRQRPPSTGAGGGPTVRASIDAFPRLPEDQGQPEHLRAYASVLDRTGE